MVTELEVADYLQDWFERKTCDGFNIMPRYIPGEASHQMQQALIPNPSFLSRRPSAQALGQTGFASTTLVATITP
jgi:hypothetical protein